MAAVALFGAPLASAQNLGEAAAREQKKREERKKKGATAPDGRVYTEEDLRPGSLSAEPKPSPSAKATPTPAATPTPTPAPAADLAAEEAERSAEKASWQARADQVRQDIASADAEVKRLEARVEGLRNDRGASNAMDPFRLQTIQAELASATSDLEAARNKAAAARQRQDALEDEARRAGVPPGWLRER